MDKKILLISADKDIQTFGEQAAREAGKSLMVVSTYKEGVECLDTDEPSDTIVHIFKESDFFDFEKQIQERIGLYSDKLNANNLHVISQSDLSEIQNTVHSPVFGNFIFQKIQDPVNNGKHFGRLLKFINRERAFGLENFFDKSVKVQQVTLKLASQKQLAVEAVRKVIMSVNFKSRMASVVANAVDELLMNAIFDAPADELGHPLFETVSRDQEMELKGKQEVTMQIGYDGTYLGVSVRDLYGSLDKSRLMTRISRRYREEEYQVKETRAGAGIGLGTVFRLGGSLLFASESHVRTEVTVLFKNSSNYREFKDQFRFFTTQFYF